MATARELHPAFLAAMTFGHKVFLPVVLSQSLIGTATVLCAALLAGEMFGGAAGGSCSRSCVRHVESDSRASGNRPRIKISGTRY